MEYKHQEIYLKKGYVTKRGFDVFFCLILLVLASPILLVTSICIKLSDTKAPVFFKQARVGRNGEHFTIIKFRTMVTDAEKQLEELLAFNEVEGAMFKMKQDPRVTKLGAVLRKTSIDELPQLFNVIAGDMSLVGPRPPLPSEVENYSQRDLLRLSVLPGITGLWQVSGRSDVNFQQMVDLDLDYIHRMSISYDFLILFKTVGVVLFSRGAY